MASYFGRTDKPEGALKRAQGTLEEYWEERRRGDVVSDGMNTVRVSRLLGSLALGHAPSHHYPSLPFPHSSTTHARSDLRGEQRGRPQAPPRRDHGQAVGFKRNEGGSEGARDDG